MEGLYNRRFVRTFIIYGSDRLKIPRAYSKLKESPSNVDMNPESFLSNFRGSCHLFREAFYNREIARKVVADLLDKNLDAELLVPEDDDISLSERVRRINAHCLALGKKNVIVVSIHVNAAGNGAKWLNATGWRA